MDNINIDEIVAKALKEVPRMQALFREAGWEKAKIIQDALFNFVNFIGEPCGYEEISNAYWAFRNGWANYWMNDSVSSLIFNLINGNRWVSWEEFIASSENCTDMIKSYITKAEELVKDIQFSTNSLVSKIEGK